MRLWSKPSKTPAPRLGVQGPARVDSRTKNLTRRLQEGDIAVIDHTDIDRMAGEALAACKPAAVLNASPSSSGRFPNAGPQIIVDAGIPLIDSLGPEIMSIPRGSVLSVETDTGNVRLNDELLAQGKVQSELSVQEMMERASEGLNAQITAFAENTMSYLAQEGAQLIDGIEVPSIRTSFEGKQVLIVVRGYHYKDDLQVLKPYVSEYRPIIIGVDGGADAVLEAGLKLDMVVGDMDSVSDKALTSGAEIVVHAYVDGRAPGAARVEQLGVNSVIFPAPGTSEDVAMILADEKGASLIVAVGSHMTLVEFLDKGREGMASTFITRLRVGRKLVDAKGVSRLYRQRVSTWQLLLLALAGLLAVGAALAATLAGQTFLGLIGARFDAIAAWFGSWLPWM